MPRASETARTTITLPAELSRWALVYSARTGVSLSSVVTQLLEGLRDFENEHHAHNVIKKD